VAGSDFGVLEADGALGRAADRHHPGRREDARAEELAAMEDEDFDRAIGGRVVGAREAQGLASSVGYTVLTTLSRKLVRSFTMLFKLVATRANK